MCVSPLIRVPSLSSLFDTSTPRLTGGASGGRSVTIDSVMESFVSQTERRTWGGCPKQRKKLFKVSAGRQRESQILPLFLFFMILRYPPELDSSHDARVVDSQRDDRTRETERKSLAGVNVVDNRNRQRCNTTCYVCGRNDVFCLVLLALCIKKRLPRKEFRTGVHLNILRGHHTSIKKYEEITRNKRRNKQKA